MADQTPPSNMFAEINPRFEWVQGEGFVTLLVYVTGFKKDKMKVKVDNASRRLKITGYHDLGGNKAIQFEKNFSVPKDCAIHDINEVKAKFDNGVLYVVLPKYPALNPRQFSCMSLNGVVPANGTISAVTEEQNDAILVL